jgi:hypothetical protein
MVKSRRDSVWVMNQHRHLDAPRVRLFAAIVLVVISITASALLLVADGIGGDVRWAHHSGASAAPLLLVAAAITAVSIAHPPKGRHALMRLVAILAFAAWGTAQLAPDPAVAGALNDVAILLFVVDAGCAVLSDARALRAAHRRRVPATLPAPSPRSSDRPVLLIRESAPPGVANPTCCGYTARGARAPAQLGPQAPSSVRPRSGRTAWPVRRSCHGMACPRGAAVEPTKAADEKPGFLRTCGHWPASAPSPTG